MKITVIGGDDRLSYCARMLAERGHSVTAYALSLPAGRSVALSPSPEGAVREADAVILPIPVGGAEIKGTEGLTAAALLPALRQGVLVLGGNLSASLLSDARRRGILTADFLTHEPFVLKNAYLTAQAALGILLRELPLCLYRTPIAMLGFGRIAKFLSRMLVSLGADVTVYARRETDRTMASLIGMRANPTSSLSESATLSRYSAIINTVPARLLPRDAFLASEKGTLVLELASGNDNLPLPPESSGVRLLLAHGLPGKCYPISAGEAVADATEALLALSGR